MLNKFKFLLYFSNVLTTTAIPFQTQAANNLGSKLLVGYWHNFDNGTGIIKLRDVSPKWDVITYLSVKLVVIVPLLNFPCIWYRCRIQIRYFLFKK